MNAPFKPDEELAALRDEVRRLREELAQLKSVEAFKESEAARLHSLFLAAPKNGNAALGPFFDLYGPNQRTFFNRLHDTKSAAIADYYKPAKQDLFRLLMEVRAHMTRYRVEIDPAVDAIAKLRKLSVAKTRVLRRTAHKGNPRIRRIINDPP